MTQLDNINDPKKKYDWKVFFSLIVTLIIATTVIILRECN